MKAAVWLLFRFGAGTRATAVLRWLALLLVLAWLIRRWVWMPVLINGASMLPTFHSGQLATINKTAYWFRAPQRGDVVVIWTGREFMVKRVLALPGEEAAISNGCVYIAGRQLQEPYVAFWDECNIAPGRIPPRCYLVAGDNRLAGLSALVTRRRIVGRVQRSDFSTAGAPAGLTQTR